MEKCFKKGFACFCVIISLIVISAESKSMAQESIKNDAWEYWGYDIKNTHNTPLPGPESNSLAWRYQIGNCESLTAMPILSDGMVFLQDDMGKLYAVDNQNPKLTKWVYQLEPSRENPFTAAPCIWKNIVYAVSGKQIISFYARHGKVKDIYDFNEPINAFTVNDDILYAATYGGTFSAIDTDSGKIDWQFKLEEESFLSYPAIDANTSTIYFRGISNLYALGLEDGSLKWKFEVSSNTAPVYGKLSSPVIGDDGTIYVGDTLLYAINPEGSLKWKLDLGFYINASPALQANTLYVGTSMGKFYAISAKDAAILWEYDTQGWIFSSAAATLNAIYLASNDGNVYAFGPKDGDLKWVYHLGNVGYGYYGESTLSPAIGKQGLYIASDSFLYVIGPPDEKK